jgi:oxygen-independent coproporphyrinogen-3 oxidase
MVSEVIRVVSSTIEEKLLQSCSAVIAAFFPGKKIELAEVLSASKELIMEINTESPNSFRIRWLEDSKIILQEVIDSPLALFENGFRPPGKEPLFQILVKRAIFIFLKKLTGKDNPWGILTGIRPGKLLRKMADNSLTAETQTKILTALYSVSEEKTRLLQSIAAVQSPYLNKYQANPKVISVYLTIPFCPSRCFYCSFPSEQLSAHNQALLSQYLQTLHEEIRMTGQMMRELGLRADNIYIGGGTPTILEAGDLEMLLRVIRDNISTEKDLEFTVEGGRPDTIDSSKLKILKNYGINRLSINPQSMQDETLKRIGRKHQVSDILNCYVLAREMADWVINMDLILGLPGEKFAEVSDSCEEVLKLRPDNLTVHALALKRGSIAWEENYVHSCQENWLSLQSLLDQRLGAEGYRPYYLYRQKNIVGNLENVGYALPGKECRYNIAIIEEKQNILGLGAGAASKILQGNSGHVNIYNPLGLNHYLKGYRQVHLKRLQALLGS